MSDIFVERGRDGDYLARQGGRVIARGETQEQAALRARRKRPDDPILAERVRDTKRGVRDKWRRIYP
jgi:hypothetical protein